MSTFKEHAFLDRIKPHIPSLLLLISVTGLCILCMEIAVRAHIFGVKGLSYSRMKSVRDFGVSGLIQASSNQKVLWELKPNLDTVNKFVEFDTNGAGLRDKEYPLTKPAGAIRVAVLGDSFTMPEGVAIEDAYHSLLEKHFSQVRRQGPVEFINFGVAGYSLPQYQAVIQEKVLAYEPDLILIGFCGANDSETPNFDNFKRAYHVKQPENGFLKMYSFELIGDAYKVIYNQLKNRKAGYDANPSYVDEQFRALAALSHSSGIPIAVAYIDNKAPSLDFNLVRTASEKHGFTFLNGAKKFDSSIDPEHIIYATDKHPNAAAHKLIAKALIEEISALRVFARMTPSS